MPAFNKCVNTVQARLKVLSTKGGDVRHTALTNPMWKDCDARLLQKCSGQHLFVCGTYMWHTKSMPCLSSLLTS